MADARHRAPLRRPRRRAAKQYERQISDLVAEDPETEAYVAHLEETHDLDETAVESLDELVNEVERFLREQ